MCDVYGMSCMCKGVCVFCVCVYYMCAVVCVICSVWIVTCNVCGKGSPRAALGSGVGATLGTTHLAIIPVLLKISLAWTGS